MPGNGLRPTFDGCHWRLVHPCCSRHGSALRATLTVGSAWGAALAALLLSNPALAGGPLFPAAQYYACRLPSSMVAGDLNGDGWIDLAVTNGFLQQTVSAC